MVTKKPKDTAKPTTAKVGQKTTMTVKPVKAKPAKPIKTVKPVKAKPIKLPTPHQLAETVLATEAKHVPVTDKIPPWEDEPVKEVAEAVAQDHHGETHFKKTVEFKPVIPEAILQPVVLTPSVIKVVPGTGNANFKHTIDLAATLKANKLR